MYFRGVGKGGGWLSSVDTNKPRKVSRQATSRMKMSLLPELKVGLPLVLAKTTGGKTRHNDHTIRAKKKNPNARNHNVFKCT